MSNNFHDAAQEDFSRARLKELFSRIFNFFRPGKRNLMSFDEVKKILSPKNESYKGLRTIPVARIVGSEGRYKDFNNKFLPKKEHLKPRWTNIDKAILTDIVLPPIQVYELGGLYFVRDGNHRVSVARIQGMIDIDAEVVSLNSEIDLEPHMDTDAIRRAVIQYEHDNFYKKINFQSVISDYDLTFTAVGRYHEVLLHIYEHKYFINQNMDHELSFDEALYSWYEQVYKPIIDIIRHEQILDRFPRRTEGDLYIWTVKHWHYLKERYGEQVSQSQAVKEFDSTYGKSLWQRVRYFFGKLFSKSHREDGNELDH